MSLDHDDYATLARIEDHLRRIADALEATGRETRQVDLTAPTDDDPGEYPALRCAVYGSPAGPRWDDCERPADQLDPLEHEWSPGRHIAEGMTVRIIGADGSTRVGTVGEFRPSPIPDYAARVMADCETGDDALCLETGEPVPVHVAVTNRQTGAILFDGDMAKLPAGLIDLPQGGWSADDLVQPMADPLDESDHRPRHDRDGVHIVWGTCGHWHSPGYVANIRTCPMTRSTLAAWSSSYGPLTFCDCDAATDTDGAKG